MAVSKPGQGRVPAAAADRAAAALTKDLTFPLDSLAGPASGILEIRGEPWIGKTRLLHQIIDAADRQGWNVAHAAAGPPSGALPFQLFTDAFEKLLTEKGDAVLKTVSPANRPALSLLFPTLDPALDQTDLPASLQPELAGRAVRDLVQALQGPQGLLLAFDNVHWADPASIDLLETLLRKQPTAQSLIVIVHRDRQSPPKLRGVLATASNLRRIEVGPSQPAELTALLPTGLTRSQRRSLIRRADGNPGLLRALIASMEWDVDSMGREGLDSVAPYLDDFRALSEDGWLVAQAAAVLGDGFDVAEVERVAGISESRVAHALGELTREDVVRPGEAGGYRFRHQLLRSVAYHSAGEGWRLAAHTTASSFVRVPNPCGHSGSGTRPCPSWTTERVRSGLLATLHDDSASDEVWLHDQRIRTGKALVVAGRPVEALDVLDRTVRPGLSVSGLARAEAAEWRARAQRLLGRHAFAESQLEGLQAEIDPEPEAIALLELGKLAAVLERGRPPRGGESWALRWASGHRDPLTRAYAQALLGAWDADTGRVLRAAIRLREVADLVDEMDDSHLIGRLDALYWMARAQARLEQDREAVRHFERGLGIAETHELEYLVPQFATGLAEVALRLGRIEQATDAGRQAIRSADRIGSGYLAAEAQAALARVAWISGDRTTASEAARRAVEHAEAWREPWADRVRLTVLETTLETDELGLRKGILSAGTVTRAAAFPVIAQVPAIGEVLARVEAARSAPGAAAAQWADAAEEAASQMRLPGATGLALLARAHHHLVADPLASAAFASSAVVALTRAGRLLDVARAHLIAAAAWTLLADATAASTQLTDARNLLDGCGAHGYLEQVARLTATDSPQAADVRLALLSGREREIAVLVSDGYTNQQIARALRLSHKTVETHLSRIFKKLDVTSRAQVATSIGRSNKDWTTQVIPGRLVRKG